MFWLFFLDDMGDVKRGEANCGLFVNVTGPVVN